MKSAINKGKNKNYQRIDNLIVDAYREIIKETGNADISITELCDKANVNRTTFYKHYRGVYDITDKLENELIYQLFNVDKSQKIGFINFLNNPKEALERLNNNLLSNLDYYRQFCRPERIRYIIDKTSDAIINDLKASYPKLVKNSQVLTAMRIHVAYFVGATVNLYLQWLQGYLNGDINNISSCICHVTAAVHQNIIDYLNKL